MSLSHVAYPTATGSGPFGVPFAYQDRDYVKAIRANGDLVELAWASASTVNLVGVTLSSELLVIYRETDAEEAAIEFARGVVSAPDLNRQVTQLLFLAQEGRRDLDRAVVAPLGEDGVTLEPEATREGGLALFSEGAITSFHGDPGEVLGFHPSTGLPVSTPQNFVVDTSVASVASTFAAEATAWPVSTSYIRTYGYLAVGDLGGALWKRASAQPNHEGKFQSVDLAWWEIAENVIDTMMVGTLGDGTTDDRTAAFNADDAAFALDRVLQISRPLFIDSDLTITARLQFMGAGQIIPGEDVDVRIMQPFEAGIHHIFDTSASGARVILPDAMAEAQVAWWGAASTRVDNEVPIQACIDALEGAFAAPSPNTYGGGTAKVHRARLLVSSSLTQRDRVSLEGPNARDFATIKANVATWDGSTYMVKNVKYDKRATITGITAASPPVVTAAAHGFVTDEIITIEGVEGMVEANLSFTKITVLDANSFTLRNANTGVNLDGTGWTAYTSGGLATKYASQFGVGQRHLTFDASGIADIAAIIDAESWNEQCGSFNCLFKDYDVIGIKIRKGYGGSALSTVSDCEFMGNPGAGGRGIDAQVLDGFSMLYHTLAVSRTTITGSANSIIVADKVHLLLDGLHMEDAAQGVFMSGASRMSGSGLKGARDTLKLVGINSDWTGRIDSVSYSQGPATGIIEDFRAGKIGYSAHNGEFLPGPLNYPFQGLPVFGATVTAGATPPATTSRQLASVVLAATGQHRVTLATGFSFGNQDNFYGEAWVPTVPDATAFSAAPLRCELVTEAGNVFSIFTVDAAGTPTNPAKIAFNIYHID